MALSQEVESTIASLLPPVTTEEKLQAVTNTKETVTNEINTLQARLGQLEQAQTELQAELTPTE